MASRRLSARDVIAGISVALILIPQSLAYAEIAGMPAYVGLFAAALPPLFAAPFASSRYLQTGPVAMTSLLTFGGLAVFVESGVELGSAEYVALGALLAIIVGVVRILLGSIKAGVIAYLMSQPVVTGFTSAAAILISASQIPNVLGVQSEGRPLLVEAADWLTTPSAWNATAIGLGLATVAIVGGGRKLHALFPGVLIAVVGGIIFSTFAAYAGPIVGSVPEGLPPIGIDLPWSSLTALLIPGFVIALVGFAEPAAIARTFATQDREAWDPNREFFSQGVANVVSGLSGAFPVGGSFSRSSVAKLAGAQSRWAGAVTGLTVLAFLPFASVIEQLPRAILGAIVIVGVYKLIRLIAMAKLFSYSKLQAGVAWATFVATLTLAPRIDRAVMVGVVLGVAVHLWRESGLSAVSWSEADLVHIQPTGVLYFGSAPILGDRITAELAAHPETKGLVLDLVRLGRIDYTGALALKSAVQEAEEAGISVSVSNVPAHSRATLERVWEADLPEIALGPPPDRT